MEIVDERLNKKLYKLMFKITMISILFFICAGSMKIIKEKDKVKSPLTKINGTNELKKFLKK